MPRKGKPQSSFNKTEEDTILWKPQTKHQYKYLPSFMNIQTPQSQSHTLFEQSLGENQPCTDEICYTMLMTLKNRQVGWPSSKAVPVTTQGSQRWWSSLKLQHYNFGNASISGHHPPKGKRHTLSLYLINYPKSKQQDALLALKPASNYRVSATPQCGTQFLKEPEKVSLIFLKTTVCVSI